MHIIKRDSHTQIKVRYVINFIVRSKKPALPQTIGICTNPTLNPWSSCCRSQTCSSACSSSRRWLLDSVSSTDTSPCTPETYARTYIREIAAIITSRFSHQQRIGRSIVKVSPQPGPVVEGAPAPVGVPSGLAGHPRVVIEQVADLVLLPVGDHVAAAALAAAVLHAVLQRGPRAACCTSTRTNLDL